MENKEKIAKMREDAKNILVASFYKETQVGRSIGSSNKDGKMFVDTKKFNRELLQAIIKLRTQVDNCSIKNSDIRNEIESLSEKTGVSIGQSQKVINVYLKFYCLLLDKPLEIIRELDCPLDSTTMDKKQKMKNVKTMEEYNAWQLKFEDMFGLRLLRDTEYDLNRMTISFEGRNTNIRKYGNPDTDFAFHEKPKIKKITKKSVCLEFLYKTSGGSIEEMARAIVDRGMDPDFEKNIRVCKLWMTKIGIPVKRLKNGNFIKA